MVYWYYNLVIVLFLPNVCVTDEGKIQKKRVDSQWEAWMPWVPCSVTCGVGDQYRSRHCIKTTESAPECNGNAVDTQKCDMNVICTANTSTWETWSSWTVCTATCGPGNQWRIRTCNVITGQCVGASVESRECDAGQCQVNGSWGLWSAWSLCSVTCGSGNVTRMRSCDSPVPANGGKTCEGFATERTSCSTSTMCAVNGSWGIWSAWSSCSVTCGSGNVTRMRSCDSPVPANGGKTCEGFATESTSCSTATMCAVNGSWGIWSAWSSCSVTCGSGNVTRMRSCDSPVPANGGKTCEGFATESTSCSTATMCAVNGSWGIWSAWSSCSVTCGSGNVTRMRSCDSPVPANGGKTCEGFATESTSCSTATMCAEKPTILSVTSSPSSPVDGNKVTLSCNATGHPTPAVHWIYLSHLGFSYVPPNIHYSPDETQLTIDAYAGATYGGTWTCFAINSVGTASQDVQI